VAEDAIEFFRTIDDDEGSFWAWVLKGWVRGTLG
jgi:hypothetical protein